MKPLYYLRDPETHEITTTNDVLEWGRNYGNGWERTVQKTSIKGLLISTVFLGIDHNFGFDGPPVLWETMVFAEDSPGSVTNFADLYCRRYTSEEDALRGHALVVWAIENGRGLEALDDGLDVLPEEAGVGTDQGDD